jgi:signal transduction histidine kinase
VWQNYKEQEHQLDQTLLHEMQLFSYNPRSDTFDVGFVSFEAEKRMLGQLYKDTTGTYALFAIPNTKKYLLKVALSQKKYLQRLEILQEKIYAGVYLYILLILLIAALFAYYTLYPLKKALRINEEFVKDILHDINTPLSSLLINLKILKKRFGEDRGFVRMENSIETIGSLQSNLKSFLHRQPQGLDRFSLNTLLNERLEYFRVLYPDIVFLLDIERDSMIQTNHEAYTRIIDNLLSNAGKYNTKHGQVKITFAEELLCIEDTGIGIKEPHKVFERYYKEGERGLGLGLHIVQKLSVELGIGLVLKSKQGEGTQVTLELSKVIVR